MKIMARNLTQDGTYWARSGVDGFNKPTFTAPVLIKCRWQESCEMVTNKDGQQVQSNAVVYVNRDVNYGGFIQLGDFTDNASPFDSSDDVDRPYPIIIISRTPSLGGTHTLIKATL